jgi:hypothetical protein
MREAYDSSTQVHTHNKKTMCPPSHNFPRFSQAILSLLITSTEKCSNLFKHGTQPPEYYKPILDMTGPKMAKKNNGWQI